MTQGLWGPLDRHARRRLELARTVLEDPWELGDIYSVAAWVSFALGRYREAVALAEEGLERTTEAAPGVHLHCLAWQGVALWRLGQWDRVLESLERAMDLLGDRRTTPPAFSFPLLGSAAFVHEARGNRAAAERILLGMRSSARQLEQPHPFLKVFEAEIQLRRGAFQDAQELLTHPYFRGSQRGNYELLQVRSRLIADAGLWDRAPALIQEMRDHASEAELVALPFFADRLEGQAALVAGNSREAVELLARSREGLAGLGARWEAGYVDLSLAEALIASGGRETAGERLRDALEVFQYLGSIRERDRARELLDRLS
jgi:tetratricopeptide (TPR) repeat protein